MGHRRQTPVLPCAVQQAIGQVAGAHSQRRPRRWCARQQRLPDGIGPTKLDAAVLQQPAPLPALGIADALDAIGVDQVGGGAAGKTVGVAIIPLAAELQGLVQGGKGLLQPATDPAVGLLAFEAITGQHQGVTEIGAVQHGAAARGAPHQIQLASALPVEPLGLELPLMKSQREGQPAPAVQA